MVIFFLSYLVSVSQSFPAQSKLPMNYREISIKKEISEGKKERNILRK